MAFARTIKAVDGNDNFDDKLMMRTVENLDMVTKRRSDLSSSTALKAARLASLQTKLLLLKTQPREKLFEKIGEYLFLEGKLLGAREAFLIGLRNEGNQDLRLNILRNFIKRWEAFKFEIKIYVFYWISLAHLRKKLYLFLIEFL